MTNGKVFYRHRIKDVDYSGYQATGQQAPQKGHLNAYNKGSSSSAVRPKPTRRPDLSTFAIAMATDVANFDDIDWDKYGRKALVGPVPLEPNVPSDPSADDTDKDKDKIWIRIRIKTVLSRLPQARL